MNMSENWENSRGIYYAIIGRAVKNIEERDEMYDSKT